MLTDYHAKLYAHELMRRKPMHSVDRLATTLMDSRVDLNPHQVDAALFAIRSPLSKGVILADEVGLGKTIEAGIVLSQKWAENRRHLLIIAPASLRKQWQQELLDKFYLSSEILDAETLRRARSVGQSNPFLSSGIVICSYQFARNQKKLMRAVSWDLIVFDEAHRLRNVYKPGNKIARELRDTLESYPKLLLTATPLQNSLCELYGLVSFIDEHTFGKQKTFVNQYTRTSNLAPMDDLKLRLQPLCKRTLRRQVLEYVRFTERKPYTQEFYPSEEEEVLYDMVSAYLSRSNLQALPSSQRQLMTLVLRKLLASSTFAIAGALATLTKKLEAKLKQNDRVSSWCTDLPKELSDDFDRYSELDEEFGECDDQKKQILGATDRKAIIEEIQELQSFYQKAVEIEQNAKGTALLKALSAGFKMAETLGASKKAVIFTESRRTQDYLTRLLSENGYNDKIVLFNGSNNGPATRQLYSEWVKKHQGDDILSGSKNADTRAALVDFFKNHAQVMIATEAAAEGINLQFCSIVVNYDLPWNPQRIEQRIGRCHRYGQKHDVVVINFINRRNAADCRVYELLKDKFHLFEGVFGASDEVLGSIESGVDFERRIAAIYQTCRTEQEIQSSFDKLQSDLGEQIDENMRGARKKILENFDSEVAEKLSVFKEETAKALDRNEFLLWSTTKHLLVRHAEFDEKQLTFTLQKPPTLGIAKGVYALKPQDNTAHHYRPYHPLAKWVLAIAREKPLPAAELHFDYSNSGRKISSLTSLIGMSGTLTVYKATISAGETEDFIMPIAVADDGTKLTLDQARRLFDLTATIKNLPFTATPPAALARHYEQTKTLKLNEIAARSTKFMEEEINKVDRWFDDHDSHHRSELEKTDEQIRQARNQVRLITDPAEKLAHQHKISAMLKKRAALWKDYDEAQNRLSQQREEILDNAGNKLKQTLKEETLFSVRFRVG